MNNFDFFSSYTKNLIDQINEINFNILHEVVLTLDKTIENKSKIYIIGNGGSAATASHMANDLGIGLKIRGVAEFDVESLADNISVCTAIANDTGYENIFYYQIKNKITKHDVLIAISCSGNSSNIIKAVEYAKSIGTTVIGLTGFDGGKLKGVSDISFHVPTEKYEYGLVEDIHMIFDHILFSFYKSKT